MYRGLCDTLQNTFHSLLPSPEGKLRAGDCKGKKISKDNNNGFCKQPSAFDKDCLCVLGVRWGVGGRSHLPMSPSTQFCSTALAADSAQAAAAVHDACGGQHCAGADDIGGGGGVRLPQSPSCHERHLQQPDRWWPCVCWRACLKLFVFVVT